MSAAARGSAPQEARLATVDRYLVPVAERPLMTYFLERLFVAHGLRERMLRAALASPLGAMARPLLFEGTWHASAGPYRLRQETAAASSADAERWRRAATLMRELEAAPDALHAAGIRVPAPGRTIVLRDYGNAERGRLLVFSFRPGGVEPSAVVKLRHHEAPAVALRREHDALLQVRTRPALADSVPEPLFYGRTEGAEILVLSSLRGTSAYVEMQNLLRPSRRVAIHLQSAAEWLARFHLETGHAHGDYWARNILLRPLPGGGTGVAVVDWEDFSAHGDPLRDLFHFPVTYGLNYPCARYRRCQPAEAFRRTFLERTRLAEQVATYFGRYCDLTGLDGGRLRPGLESYLAERAAAASPPEADEWRACAGMLASRRMVVEP